MSTAPTLAPGTAVCVLAKPPVPGRVKTRLAATIGPEAAAALASAMLCDTWRTVNSVARLKPILAAAGVGQFPTTLSHATVWLQDEGDLGCRMERIACRAIKQFGRVILLGADSPELAPTHLVSALAALEDHDAVIGPSLDGGYYLLGLTRCPTDLLHNLPWSTPETRASTEQRLRAHGFSIAYTDPLADIDVIADLLASKAPGQHTKQWMNAHSSLLSVLEG